MKLVKSNIKSFEIMISVLL